MSAPIVPTRGFVPDNRLSTALAGMSPEVAAELVRRAERAVDQIVPLASESLLAEVERLIQMCRQDEAGIFARCHEIGWLALTIVESAGLARQPALMEAARGIREMTEALSDRGVWHTDALVLHIDALQALASGSPIDAEEMAAMERALLEMRTAIGATAPP